MIQITPQLRILVAIEARLSRGTASPGGRRARKQAAACARIRCNCCWRAAIRKPKPHRYGGV